MPFDSIPQSWIGQNKPVGVDYCQRVKDNQDALYSDIVTARGLQVPNGSFEVDSDSDGVPDLWTPSYYPGGSGAIETTNPIHGSKAWKFTHPGGSGNGGGYIDSDYMECSPLGVLTLFYTLWCSVGGVRNQVYVRYYDKGKVYLSEILLHNHASGPMSATRHKKNFTPPSSARYLRIRLVGGHSSQSAAGNTWFDDILFEPGDRFLWEKKIIRELVNTSWIARTSAADNNWRNVCWSPELGLFVAVADTGTGNRIMTSPNGANWTLRTSPVNNDWWDTCWSPELGLFITVATSGIGNRVMTSPDGINWTARTSAADNNWEDICWSPELSLLVAVAVTGIGNRIMTSPDGINWTARTSAADNSWRGVCWSPELSMFAAVASTGTNNRVMTSTDGINWTIRTPAVDNNWWDICWSPGLGLFVAVATSGTGNRVMTSPDGINWTARTSAVDNNWEDICWSPELSLLVAVAVNGTGNRVMTSPDGINWTIRNSAADNEWRGVCWSPELKMFVAVSRTGTGNRVMTTRRWDGID